MRHNTDLEPLRHALAAQAETIAEHLLGPPTYRGRSELRWGRRGSLSLALASDRRGLWHDFERGEGGDLLALIRRERRCGFREALAFVRGLVGEPVAPPPRAAALPPPRPQPQRDTAALALRLWSEAREGIGGTPAEAYLLSRGIRPERLPPHSALAGWPAALRWHAERSALVIAVNCGTSGLVRAVQTIALQPDGSPKLRDGRKVKRTYGPLRGSSARFGWQPDPLGRWALAEGAESALAAAALLGCPCWASLGASNLPHVRPPSWARSATICADHDDAGLRAAEEAARNLQRLGLAATVITPERDGADAADIAREVARA